MPIESILLDVLVLPLGKFLLKKYLAAPLDDLGGSLLALAGKSIVDRRVQQETAQEFDRLSREAVNRLVPLFNDYEGRHDVNVEAVIHEIATTLDGRVDAKFFLEKDLDAAALEAELRKQRPLPKFFEQANLELYDRALKGTVLALLDVAPKLPHFESQLAARNLSQLKKITVTLDVLQATTQGIKESAERIEKRLSGSEEKASYEGEYRSAVKANLDFMELFGADLKPNQKKHKLLSVAYVSLNLQHANRGGTETAFSTEDLLDTLRPGNGRLLIQGDAGSGKSTLFRWIAIAAAQGIDKADYSNDYRAQEIDEANKPLFWARIFVGPPEAYWRLRIPFLLRLRECNEGLLPPPEDFPLHISRAIGNPPAQWVKSVLDDRRGLILLDGIDEIPHQHRDALRTSVEDYLTRYEGNYFLMSARPAAVRDWEEWFRGLGFHSATINPMTEDDKAQLIHQWHQAVARTLQATGEDATGLADYGEALISKLKKLPTVSQLAVYPLLCAMICALHYWRDQELPQSYWELCEDLCAMLLHKRDKESKVRIEEFPPCYAQLNYGHKRRLVQRVAMKMVEPQVISSIEHDAVLRLAQDMLRLVPQRTADEASELVECLIERSGILREPVAGHVDFIHNTFKEFLAADWLVMEKQTDLLLQNATNPDWEKIILFAAGSNDEQIATRLIGKLLDSGGHANRLLAIRCRTMARYLDSALETKLDEVEKTLFPPRKMADAEVLATLGEAAVDYLKHRSGLRATEAAACIRALRLIGTLEAQQAIEGYFSDHRHTVIDELAQTINPLLLPSVQANLLHGRHLPEHSRKCVKDLTPLVTLTSLQTLDLRNTGVSDVSPLAALTSLQYLNLWNLAVSDIGPLAALTSLQRLFLNGTKVSNVDPLVALTSLRELNLTHTPVSDIGPLAALTSLQRLFLSGTKVSHIYPLSSLTSLQSFHLSNTKVSDVGPLAALTSLQRLDLSYTPVSDVRPLAALTNLQELNLSGTNVSDVGPLAALTNLQELDLSGTNVSDVGPLEAMTSLRELNLRNTKASDLTPLAALTSLQRLYLIKTAVSDVSPLAALTNLQTIWLEGTQVTDVSPLAALTNLKHVDLSQNKKGTVRGEEELEGKIHWY